MATFYVNRTHGVSGMEADTWQTTSGKLNLLREITLNYDFWIQIVPAVLLKEDVVSTNLKSRDVGPENWSI